MASRSLYAYIAGWRLAWVATLSPELWWEDISTIFNSPGKDPAGHPVDHPRIPVISLWWRTKIFAPDV